MVVCYNKLFKLMIDKKMTNAELADKAGFSANSVIRLKRDKYVSLDSVEKICGVLGCGTDDILEFVADGSDQREDHRHIEFVMTHMPE